MLRGLQHLKEWELEDGAMITLKRLVICNCHYLKMLPGGLKHTSDLQELELVQMPRKFIKRFRKNGGEDLHKIQRSTPISLNIREPDSKWKPTPRSPLPLTTVVNDGR
ncbi:hypothetical protein QJS10_CPA05g02122 [Acorus calamus]|uniref:Uncharacterized protein n=1 Tax=Acorus calamus TaxID=4465 RepID=A0AAV9ERC9_ACOCL|nr:hypothetical protein QJS10_CPA05g02122 [Acorus calamus]